MDNGQNSRQRLPRNSNGGSGTRGNGSGTNSDREGNRNSGNPLGHVNGNHGREHDGHNQSDGSSSSRNGISNGNCQSSSSSLAQNRGTNGRNNGQQNRGDVRDRSMSTDSSNSRGNMGSKHNTNGGGLGGIGIDSSSKSDGCTYQKVKTDIDDLSRGLEKLEQKWKDLKPMHHGPSSKGSSHCGSTGDMSSASHQSGSLTSGPIIKPPGGSSGPIKAKLLKTQHPRKQQAEIITNNGGGVPYGPSSVSHIPPASPSSSKSGSRCTGHQTGASQKISPLKHSQSDITDLGRGHHGSRSHQSSSSSSSSVVPTKSGGGVIVHYQGRIAGPGPSRSGPTVTSTDGGHHRSGSISSTNSSQGATGLTTSVDGHRSRTISVSSVSSHHSRSSTTGKHSTGHNRGGSGSSLVELMKQMKDKTPQPSECKPTGDQLEKSLCRGEIDTSTNKSTILSSGTMGRGVTHRIQHQPTPPEPRTVGESSISRGQRCSSTRNGDFGRNGSSRLSRLRQFMCMGSGDENVNNSNGSRSSNGNGRCRRGRF